ncbi:hypothetical protein DPMN_085960 [Dreissena polymorpha]|uniref:Uncharacterized protein n=1 Tax=Dreissena polymorpha TaxID=45954 RepID=A0A9D4BJV8_DREPO|nr:hypothetical protein DPMN_085960 [Dreissena polymorpha]
MCLVHRDAEDLDNEMPTLEIVDFGDDVSREERRIYQIGNDTKSLNKFWTMDLSRQMFKRHNLNHSANVLGLFSDLRGDQFPNIGSLLLVYEIGRD